MIPLYYDLHLHSCLSPCGDDDMTPSNIVGMAAIKGLNVIALTDHNTCLNCPAAIRHGQEYGVTVIPGMELTTSEEVHVVCLFSALENALAFSEYVYEHLPPIKNKEAIFGKQQVMDEQDREVRRLEKLLINATDISFDYVNDLTADYHGIAFPAHLDKSSTSLLSNLGFIPPDSKFRCAEVKDLTKLHQLKKANPYLENCRIVSNSDAHYLWDIHEADHQIFSRSGEISDILKALEDIP